MMSGGNTELTQDVLFDILSSSRRRFVLHVLKTEGEMELTELAEHVAARENETEIEELTAQQRKRVYVSLYQTHVPKLGDAGLVAYDENEQLVSLHSRADQVASYFHETESFPWQYVYLAIALAGFVVAGLTAASVGPFGTLPETAVALVLLGALLVTALVHALVRVSDRRRGFPGFRQE